MLRDKKPVVATGFEDKPKDESKDKSEDKSEDKKPVVARSAFLQSDDFSENRDAPGKKGLFNVVGTSMWCVENV